MSAEHVKLTRAMLGTRSDLVRFPEVDVQGKEYIRGQVSVRNVGPHQFVVIPSALDGAEKWDIENPYAGVSVDILTTLEGDDLAAHMAALATPPPVVEDVSAFVDPSSDESFTRKRR